MNTTMMIKADFEIELPALPNFIKTASGVALDVKDISNESLVCIAEAWKMALIKHAETRRNGK